jgi:hypothetical protein
MMTLKEITLLSKEEYRKHKSIIPEVNRWWWLKTPEYDSCVCTVDFAGFFDKSRCWLANRAVRPAGIFELDVSDSLFWHKSENLIGSKIKYGKYSWMILNAERGCLFTLCDDIVAYHCFDERTNDWDSSELKAWLWTEGLKLITT